MKKILAIISVAAAALCASSCLFEQKDLFDKTPAQRLEERMQALEDVLTTQEYGWEMDVYPGEDQPYGGYAFTLKFHGDTVDVQSELATDMTNVISSLYKTTTDSGATLSFDTYNTYFHFFSTPASGLYTAYGGEFEFIIGEVTPDLVTLIGTKTGNVAYLRALTEPATQYLEKVVAMDEYFQSWLPVVGDESTTIEIHTLERYALVTDSNGSEHQVAICPSSTGVRFYTGVEFDGGVIDEITPVERNGLFEGVLADGTMIDWIRPEGWESYDTMDFENHEWVLQCKLSTPDKTLVDAEIPVTFQRYLMDDGEKGYLMDGIWAACPIRLNYLPREGKINFRAYKYATVANTRPNLYISPARVGSGSEVAVATYYLYGGSYNDRGMMFAPDGTGSYDYVNNKAYTYIDYDCILPELFDEDLYGSSLLSGKDWEITGVDPDTPYPFACIVYCVSKLKKVR